MESLKIVLLIVVAYILYMLITKTKVSKDKVSKGATVSKGKVKSKRSNNKSVSSRYTNGVGANTVVVDDVVSWDDSGDSSMEPIRLASLNPNFLNIQFHNDYRDIITALDNLVPAKKQLFNLQNIPLVYSEPESGEVKNMVKDFIEVLNYNSLTEVPNCRNTNSGWDEKIPDPNVKSGWNKVQSELGLPEDLYQDPARRAPVKVIAVPLVQKYETEDEIKYSVDIVLQKVNVDDQMIIKADFVQDKRPLLDENNFFTTKNIDMKVTIENIFISGYLSKNGNDAIKQFDGDNTKYYDYKDMERNNMTDPKFVQKILMEKYKQRNEEMEQRTAMLDGEGQAFHRNLPSIYDFDNIKNSRSIYDDMNYSKAFV